MQSHCGWGFNIWILKVYFDIILKCSLMDIRDLVESSIFCALFCFAFFTLNMSSYLFLTFIVFDLKLGVNLTGISFFMISNFLLLLSGCVFDYHVSYVDYFVLSFLNALIEFVMFSEIISLNIFNSLFFCLLVVHYLHVIILNNVQYFFWISVHFPSFFFLCSIIIIAQFSNVLILPSAISNLMLILSSEILISYYIFQLQNFYFFFYVLYIFIDILYLTRHCHHNFIEFIIHNFL